MGIENNETIIIPQKEIQKDGATEMLNKILKSFENLDEKRTKEKEIKIYVKENYPKDYEEYQNIVDNNTTEIADFKKQFEKEVLSNPDFADGDMSEDLQKQLEIDEINDYINYLKRHLDEPQTKNGKQVTAEEIIYDLEQELSELENS